MRSPNIILAPGSGEAEKFKRWPLVHYIELARRLRAKYVDSKLVFFGLSRELPHEDHDVWKAEGILRVVPQHIYESLGLLANADVVVCGCTGTAHLAASVKIRVVAAYGPTNPMTTGPISDRFYFIRRGLRCSPCYRREFTAGCGAPVCMSIISVEDIIGAIGAALQGVAPKRPKNIDTKSANRMDSTIVPSEVAIYGTH